MSCIAIEIHAVLHPTYKGFMVLEKKLKEFGFNMLHESQVHTWPMGRPEVKIPLPVKIEHWVRAT